MTIAVKCKLVLYADDSALLVDVSEMEETLSLEHGSVSEWQTDTKLSIHLGQTESILFPSKRRLQKFNSLNVACNQNVIESKPSVTYLGVTLDQLLTGDTMAPRMICKSSNELKFLYRNTRKFNLKTKQNFSLDFDSMSF